MKLSVKRGEGNVNVNVTPNWLMLLGVIFVLLKVTGVTAVATWSWWLVLLPFYIGLAIFAGVMVALAGVAAVVIGGAFLLDGINNLYRRIKYKRK